MPRRTTIPRPTKDKTTGHYYVRWYGKSNGRTIKHKRTFRTRSEAERWIREEWAGNPGRDWTASQQTFRHWSQAWLTSRAIKERTRDGYRAALTRSLAYFGATPIGEIGPLAAEEFMTSLKADPALRTPRSVRGAWFPFAATLKYATTKRAISANPAATVTLPTDRRAGREPFKPTFLRPEQVEALAHELTPPYDLLTRFAAYSGLRAAELAALDLRHVTLSTDATGRWRGRVRVERTARRIAGGWTFDTPKSRKSTRDVPLPGWLAEDMHAYLATHPRATDPSAPLWPGRQRGGFHRTGQRSAPGATGVGHGEITYAERFEPSGFLRYVMRPAARRAGLPASLRFHDLRHTFASICSANRVPVEVVSEWMGHSSFVVTWSIYTHLFAADRDEWAERIERPERPKVVPIR